MHTHLYVIFVGSLWVMRVENVCVSIVLSLAPSFMLELVDFHGGKKGTVCTVLAFSSKQQVECTK